MATLYLCVFPAGPPPHWLFGNLPEMLQDGMHAAQERWAREYGPYVYFLGAYPMVMTMSPEHAR